MGSHVAAQMLPDGSKALAPSGATVVGQEMKPDSVALGQPALSLLDVIPVVLTHITEAWATFSRSARNRVVFVSLAALRRVPEASRTDSGRDGIITCVAAFTAHDRRRMPLLELGAPGGRRGARPWGR